MVKFAIVGCGHIAKKHITAIEAVPNAELVAVCDKVVERMAPFLKNGVTGYANYNEMLELHDIDVVNICTPSGLHRDLTVAAAESKKHVIVEKPMALNLIDANQMVDSCAENGVKLAVVHPNRFRPAVVELRKRFVDRAFGVITHANATVRWNRNQEYYDQAPWRGTKAMDGGVLLNQAIHNIDLLLWLMGDVEEIFSYDATRVRDIEAEDTSVSVLRFANGALGVIEATVGVFPRNLEETLAVFGDKGTAVIGGETANWVKKWDFADLNNNLTNALIAKINSDPYSIPGHQAIIEDMIVALNTDREPVVSGEDGKETLRLILACKQSAESGQPVRLGRKKD